MERPLVNFPLEFDKLWAFFHQFEQLRPLDPRSEEFRQAFGNLVKQNSLSTFDDAKKALEAITGSLFYEMMKGSCRSVGTRYGA